MRDVHSLKVQLISKKKKKKLCFFSKSKNIKMVGNKNLFENNALSNRQQTPRGVRHIFCGYDREHDTTSAWLLAS